MRLLYLLILLVVAHDAAGECESNDECMNDGTCELDVNNVNDSEHLHKVCVCVEDYIGQYCENQCLITCQNGGICQRKEFDDEHDGAVADSGAFICDCSPTYDGPLCATKKVDDDEPEENSTTPTVSYPVTAPSYTSEKGSSSTSSSSVAKIFGAICGVGIVVIVMALLYVMYFKKQTKLLDGSQRTKTIDEATTTTTSGTATNNLSLSRDATHPESTADDQNGVSTTILNNATITMTDDGPKFMPDTTVTIPLHDVA